MTIKFTWPLQHPSDSGGTGGEGDKGGAAAGEKKAGDQSVVGAAATKTAEELAAEKTTADTKAAADAETKRKADEAAAKSKAPEKYELKLPDGGRLDESDLKYVEEVARKANWTNDEALAAIAEQDAAIAAQSERFLAATKADKDYGGDKLVESQKLARAVIDRIRPVGHARREAFIKFVNRGGAGNHIEVVSFLADLGKMMAEDSATGGTGGGGEKKDAAAVLYGETK